jgi:hypothetical protein
VSPRALERKGVPRSHGRPRSRKTLPRNAASYRSGVSIARYRYGHTVLIRRLKKVEISTFIQGKEAEAAVKQTGKRVHVEEGAEAAVAQTRLRVRPEVGSTVADVGSVADESWEKDSHSARLRGPATYARFLFFWFLFLMLTLDQRFSTGILVKHGPGYV